MPVLSSFEHLGVCTVASMSAGLFKSSAGLEIPFFWPSYYFLPMDQKFPVVLRISIAPKSSRVDLENAVESTGRCALLFKQQEREGDRWR